MTGLAFSNTAESPPHMMPSCPFWAPAWPPDTGASMKPMPRFFASSYSSLARVAEAVVWSTRIAPFFMPASAALSPYTTERTSSSLPTHIMTKSQSFAASRGDGACLPPYSLAHCCALAAVRL
jgi:hypothetical protein